MLKQRVGASSLEGKKAPSTITPYLIGGALTSGASFALSPTRKKVYVELTYHNQLGSLIRTEGQWINVRQKTSIKIKNPVTGWVDVSVAASENQGLKIQQMNAASDSSGTGKTGDGPTTNDGDFGIEGGSGSADDPFILSNISVYPDYGDLEGFGDGFYYGSGGTVDGYTFPPGYYQDQSDYAPIPPANQSPPSINDFKWKKEPADCAAYNHLFSASLSAQKEMGGLVTADGQLITLPSQNNLINHTDLNMVQVDGDNHNIVVIYQEAGNWYVQLNDFSTSPPPDPLIYQIVAMIHTHPSGINPQDNQPWDTYNPSPDDKAVAGNYPGLQQYIKTEDSIYAFDKNGAMDGFAPGCDN